MNLQAAFHSRRTTVARRAVFAAGVVATVEEAATKDVGVKQAVTRTLEKAVEALITHMTIRVQRVSKAAAFVAKTVSPVLEPRAEAQSIDVLLFYLLFTVRTW